MFCFVVALKGRVNNVTRGSNRTNFISRKNNYTLNFDKLITKKYIKRMKGKCVILLDKLPESNSMKISIDMLMKERDYNKMCKKNKKKTSKKGKKVKDKSVKPFRNGNRKNNKNRGKSVKRGKRLREVIAND